ncbi:MAG: MlaD family protein [Nitrospirota bacterium]
MKTSKSIPWSELKVGILVVSALVLLAVGIIEIGANLPLLSRTYNLYLRMDNSLGLRVGSVVRLAGIEVGNVKDISLPSDPNDKNLVISLSIQDKYRDRIRQDSTAMVRTMGLLGDKYLDISIGSPSSPEMKPGGVLTILKETQLANVLAGASSGLEGLNVVLGQLKIILGTVSSGQGTAGLLLKDPRLYQQLNNSAAGLESVVNDLKKGKGSAGKLIEDPEVYQNLADVSRKARELVAKLDSGSFAELSEDKDFYLNLKTVSENLRDLSASSKELVENLNTGSLARISGDKELYARIDRVSSRLDSMMGRLESGQGSAGKLINDSKLYSNMNKFFEDADSLVLDVKKNPKRYIKLSLF